MRSLIMVPDLMHYSDKGVQNTSLFFGKKRRAEERARTADLFASRVVNRALQAFVRACRTRISEPVTFLCLAPLAPYYVRGGAKVI
jgi:hypothetical protein